MLKPKFSDITIYLKIRSNGYSALSLIFSFYNGWVGRARTYRMQGSKPCVLPISPRPNIGCSGRIWTYISRLMRPLSYQYSTLQYGAKWWGCTTRVLRQRIYSAPRSYLRYNLAFMESHARIELAPSAWKAEVLPLNEWDIGRRIVCSPHTNLLCAPIGSWPPNAF